MSASKNIYGTRCRWGWLLMAAMLIALVVMVLQGSAAPPSAAPPSMTPPHGGVKIDPTHCLICHGSLPPDPHDPVYQECRLWGLCAVCHGTGHGRGDGPASEFLFPRPRDFSKGLFKLRSTPSGTSPTEQDLFQVITRGIPGSAMPSFAFLSREERWALVDHVKTLGRVFETERVIEVPVAPRLTPDLVREGKRLYQKFKCWECHGRSGKGDGPSAASLKDEWGIPSVPTDFTTGIYKGGSAPGSIYLRMTAGMDGTPMPSYEDSTAPQERWALVAYLLSLARGGGGRPQAQLSPAFFTSVAIRVPKVDLPLPLSPLDPRWESVPAFEVPLSPLWQRKEEVKKLLVRGMHNGKEIALALEWEEKKRSAPYARPQDFSSACAAQFPLTPFVPSFAMGQAGYPVRIWYWREELQQARDPLREMARTYPGMIVDAYPLEEKEDRSGSAPPSAAPPLAGSSRSPSHPSPLFFPGWESGNFLSSPTGESVQEMVAEGIGTVTPLSAEKKHLQGRGEWTPTRRGRRDRAEGRWRVVFLRAREVSAAGEVEFHEGKEVPVAFAVWDGERGERDGHKSVTTWHRLRLER